MGLPRHTQRGQTVSPKPCWPIQREAGFSLVELLVVMIILFVVVGAIYTVWFGLQRSYSFTDDDMKAQTQATSALGEMVDLIRTARRQDNTWDWLQAVIVYADQNTLILWTDVDRDPSHDLELVRFRVDTGTRSLYRDTSQTGDITFFTGTSVRMISTWVSNDAGHPLFTYIGADGATMSTPVNDETQIREVQLDLLIDVYTDNRPIAHELRSVVQPRNLRQY